MPLRVREADREAWTTLGLSRTTRWTLSLTLKSKPSPKGDRYYTSAAIYGFDITERAEQFGTVQPHGDWTESVNVNPSNQEEDLPF